MENTHWWYTKGTPRKPYKKPFCTLHTFGLLKKDYRVYLLVYTLSDTSIIAASPTIWSQQWNLSSCLLDMSSLVWVNAIRMPLKCKPKLHQTPLSINRIIIRTYEYVITWSFFSGFWHQCSTYCNGIVLQRPHKYCWCIWLPDTHTIK